MFIGVRRSLVTGKGVQEPEITQAPPAPTDINIIDLAPESLSVTWVRNSFGDAREENFRLAYCSGLACDFSSSTEFVVPRRSTYYSVSGLTENTSYNFRVRAENSIGNSSWDDYGDFYTPLLAPTGISVTNITASGFDVGWTDVSVAAETFFIEWSDDDFATIAGSDSVLAGVETYAAIGIAEGTTYKVRVRAENATTGTDSSYLTSADFNSLLITPTGLAGADPTSSTVDLTWTDNSLVETGQTIEASDDDFATVFATQTVAADAQSHTFTGLDESTSYKFRVKATKTGGFVSEWNTSAAISTLASILVPNAPSAVTITSLTSTTATQGWTDNSGPGPGQDDGFTVQRCAGDLCDFSTNTQDTVGQDVVTYNWSGMSENTYYNFRVRAYNGAGASAWATSAQQLTPLLAPTSAGSSDIQTRQFTASWTNNTAAADGIDIEWSDDDFGTIAGSDAIDEGDTFYTITGLTPNTAYKFRVKATNSITSNSSPWLTSSDVTTLAVTPANISGNILWVDALDTGTITMNGSNQVSQWDDKSGNGYHLVQGTLTRQPIYQATLGTGLNFTTNKVLETPSNAVFNLRTFTVFFIHTPTGSAGNFMNDSGGSGFYNIQLTATRRRYFGYRNNANAITAAFTAPSTEFNINTTYCTDFQIVNTVSTTPVTSSSKLNNASEQTGSQNGGMNTSATSKLILGAGTSLGGGNYQGQIKEIAIFTRELTTQERTDLYDYFAAKWGI